jgi:hypothetical protein
MINTSSDTLISIPLPAITIASTMRWQSLS